MTFALDRTEAFRATCARARASTASRERETEGNDRSSDRSAKRETIEIVRECARAARSALDATAAYVEMNRASYARASDERRDAFEAETADSIAECQRCVGAARDAIERARANGALRRSPECAAHLHGIALILSDGLKEVARAFDGVRETRFAATLAKAERERQRRRAAKTATYDDGGVRGRDDTVADDVGAVHVTGIEREQTQAQVERHDALEEELTQLLEQVRTTERNVIEMSALSSLFATHVQAQAEQIESLYNDAVESSRHFEMGNVEMKKTIARKGDAQRYVAIILLVATLGLLFLDWYSG